MADDISITISRETDAVTQAGFGMPLIVDTGVSAAIAYEEFEDLASVVDGTDWTVADEGYKIAAAIFAQTPTVEKVALVGVPYVSGTDVIADDLIAPLTTVINEGNNDWYFLVTDQQTNDEVVALSAFAAGNKKMYFVSVDDTLILGNLSSDRTVVLVHKTPSTYPAEAWVGRCAPETPGSITWKFKSLDGITIPGYTASEVTAIHDADGNTYVRKLGYDQTSEGIATDGTYIDIVRGQDYIESKLQESLGRLLYTSNKIPYDDTGIAQVVASVQGVLKGAVEDGIIAVDSDGNGLYSVTAPRREDIDTNDIANRILPDVNFEFTLAGAIHQIVIYGVISL